MSDDNKKESRTISYSHLPTTALPRKNAVEFSRAAAESLRAASDAIQEIVASGKDSVIAAQAAAIAAGLAASGWASTEDAIMNHMHVINPVPFGLRGPLINPDPRG